MNTLIFLFERVVVSGGVYLFLLFVCQCLALRLLEIRYSRPIEMTAFLSRYARIKRINFEKDQSVSLADVRKHSACAWGMMGLGMMGVFYSWLSISKGDPNWLLMVASLLVPWMHGYYRASSCFAASCFSKLGIFSFSEVDEDRRSD